MGVYYHIVKRKGNKIYDLGCFKMMPDTTKAKDFENIKNNVRKCIYKVFNYERDIKNKNINERKIVEEYILLAKSLYELADVVGNDLIPLIVLGLDKVEIPNGYIYELEEDKWYILNEDNLAKLPYKCEIL